MTKDQRRIYEWRIDPVKFVREEFSVEPDPWQHIALKAFGDGNIDILRMALKACAGPGKTALLAWCGWNFLACYGDSGNHPKGAAVAITKDNLMDNLWPELARWRNASKYLTAKFTWTGSRIFCNDHPETWFLSARSWPKTANADEQGRTLSGIHSKYVLFLIDESGDIPVPVMKAAEQAMSECEWGRIMQAGNPTSISGMLYEACVTQPDLWWSMSITGDPDDPDRSPRIKKDWAIEQIKRWGRTDPWVMSYILGQFPLQAINALIGPEEVDTAMKRVITEHMVHFAEKRIGVDCARFGDDRTVIARRQGIAHYEAVTMRMADGPQIAARVAAVDTAWDGADMIFLDTTGGYGSSPEDALKLAKYTPFPVNFSARANDDRYFNLRSEMLYRFCDAVKRGAGLPNSPQLKKEMCALTYTFQNGKIRVVEKEQVKIALKCSTDEVDAYATTYAVPDKPRRLAEGGIKKRKLDEYGTPRNYDPREDDDGGQGDRRVPM